MTILFKTIIENTSIKKQFPVYIKKKKKEIKSCVCKGKNNIFLDEDNKQIRLHLLTKTFYPGQATMCRSVCDK